MTPASLETPAGGAIAASPPIKVITPESRQSRVSDLWRHLGLVWVLTVRDFKTRYKQNALGPVWLVLQPLGILTAFTVVFNGVTKIDTSGVPYTLFALVGITAWSFFSSGLGNGTRAMLSNTNLITFMDTPRSTFVTANVAASLPNLLAPLLLTIPSLFILGHGLTWHIVALPIAMAWLIVLVWSAVLLVTTVNVKYRDVSAIVPFLLQGGVFLSPVGYPVKEAPPTLETILSLNPLTGLIEFWRWSLLGSPLESNYIWLAAAWTLLLAVFSWRVFVRLEVKFADVI